MSRTHDALDAFIGIKRTNEMLNQAVRKDVAQHGLKVNEFAVLELLYHKGPQVTQDIKEKILVANSSTTYIIDKLCEKGLTYRQAWDQDKRVIYTHLTPKGHDLIVSIVPSHQEMITNLFTHLSDQEIQTLKLLLKKMNGYHLT